MFAPVQSLSIREARSTRQTFDLECRFDPGEEGTFTGIAALWDERNRHGETIQRGAFARTLNEHRSAGTRPVMLWAHRSDSVIGVWTSITEGQRGLEVTGKLVTETTAGREAHALLKAGALNGLSIGFHQRGAKRGPNGTRTLTDIELAEISLVAMPSANSARIQHVRSTPDYSDLVRAIQRTTAALKGGAR